MVISANNLLMDDVKQKNTKRYFSYNCINQLIIVKHLCKRKNT